MKYTMPLEQHQTCSESAHETVFSSLILLVIVFIAAFIPTIVQLIAQRTNT